MEKCAPCPVCGRQPKWYGSDIRDAESISCPDATDWGCPDIGSFGYSTGYLPDVQAVAAWNAAAGQSRANMDAPPVNMDA